MNRISRLFRIATENDDLVQAQLAAFSRQVPLLYFIVSVNALVLAFSYYGIAPAILTVVFPGMLVAACAIRCLIWWRRRDHTLEPKAAIRTLRLTVALAAVLGFAFLAWA